MDDLASNTTEAPDDLTDLLTEPEQLIFPGLAARPAPDFCPVHRKSYTKCGCTDDWENEE